MNNSPSITENESETLEVGDIGVREGDVALVLNKDGSMRTVMFGVDVSRLNGPEEDLTDDDRDVIEMGRVIYALMQAANQPDVMEALIKAASEQEDAPPAQHH